MALDEPREDDHTYDTDGITWLVAKADHERVIGKDGVRVDHLSSWFGGGFSITRKHARSSGCC